MKGVYMKIIKITDSPVIDFAAEELKKYLRMMMPYAGEIEITRDTSKEGFRLGVFFDFGLDMSDVEDEVHDDVIYMDTDEMSGIISGSNPRSVLLCVYQYLKKQGCRFLFPGIDGEKIPIRDITPVKYRKKADNRYRGECNEGAEFQQCMLDAIDFAPKIGFNVFMMEFAIPKNYYDKYYNHTFNHIREQEPVSAEQVLQWKRQCEAEVAKRGLLFHDMGHGWTAESFGISSINGWVKDENPEIPEEARQFVAMVNGKRELYHGIALNTNFCMSNPEARRRVVNQVVDYAKKSGHVDCLHVWLADGTKNHCECEACRKMIPSDWYAMLLNEIDAELKKENLPTKIGGCAYMDLAYEPEKVKLQNPDRFLFILGASRSYLYSVEKDPVTELTPYVRNQGGRFKTTEEYIVHAHKWMEMGARDIVSYEYHFWMAMAYCPGILSMAQRLYEDVRSYKENRLSGIIEDGTQRAFFPNGLSFYVYSHSLFDMSMSFEEIVNEYFEGIYGEKAPMIFGFFKTIDELMPQKYLEFAICKQYGVEHFHKPEVVPGFRKAKKVIAEMRETLAPYRTPNNRTELVSVRLLSDYYLDYLDFVADAAILKAQGHDDEAYQLKIDFFEKFGKREVVIERYYDQYMHQYSWDRLLKLGIKK